MSQKKIFTILLATFVANFFITLAPIGVSAIPLNQVKDLNGGWVDDSSPSINSAIVSGNANRQPFNAVGTGGFDGKFSRVKVYVPSGVSTIVSVQQYCDPARYELGNPQVTYELQSLDSNEEYYTGSTPPTYYRDRIDDNDPASNRPEVGGNCNNNRLEFRRIQASEGTFSGVSGHQSYRVFSLVATMNLPDATSSSNERNFRFSASGGAYIGASAPIGNDIYTNGRNSAKYYGVYKRDSLADGGSREWSYVTDFRADCGASLPRTANITIYDADVGVFSPQHLSVQLFKAKQGATPINQVNNWQLAKEWSSLAELGGNGQEKYLGFTPQKGYAYRVVFNDINEWNTIQIKLPFDQVNTYTDFARQCDQTWNLDNSTSINPGMGDYTAQGEPTEVDDKGTADTSDDVTIVRPKPANYWPDRNCNDYSNATNRSRCNSWNAWYDTNATNAKNAYQNARFQHAVENISPSTGSTAEDGTHKSYIEYRLKRGNSAVWRNSDNGDTGNNAWTRKSSDQSKDIDIGDSFLVNDGGSSDFSIPRSSDLAFLLKDCNSGSDDGGTPRHVCSSSNATAGPREPQTGDEYCERVITSPSRNNKGALSGTQTSTERCIKLGTAGGGDIVCQPWSIDASSEVSQLEGGGSSNAAWVNDRYEFNYHFSKAGKRSSTPNIDFRQAHVFADTGYDSNQAVWDAAASGIYQTHSLGRWDPGPNGEFQYIAGVRDGGKTYSHAVQYGPTTSTGANNCGQGGTANQGPLIVTVPYYFHIKTGLDSIGDSTEQGQSIEVNAKYNMPDVDASNGRGHTWTDNTNYKITRLINPGGTDTSVLGVGGDVCAIGAANCAIVNQGNKGHLDPNGSANTSLGIYTNPGDTVSGTGSLPVGTKVCFVSSINKPAHDAGAGDWGHSLMRCTTIVKRPKVQFRNADLTVGRPIEQSGGQCDQTTVKNNAIVQATGANAVNPFGSWIEYGVFATGEVTGFGSAATPFGAGDMYKRLTFANTTAVPGNYSYSSPCVSNVFDSVSGNLNTITASTIRPGDYFTANTDDKNGYVTDGKDLTIGEPDATGGPGGGGGGSATANNTYAVQQCSSWTNSVPVGWSYSSSAGQANSKSTGCNDSGNFLKLWLSAPRNQGEYSKWTFTAPSGTSIQRLQANRIIRAGQVDNYRGSWINVGTDSNLGDLEYCTNYAPLTGMSCTANGEDGGLTAVGSGPIDKSINASSINILADCRVDTASAAIWYGNAGIQCPDGGDTSYSIKDVTLTLKDTTSPGITVQNTGLKTTLPTQKVSGTQNLTFTANDTGSGVYSYRLTASGPDSKTYTGYIDTASSCTSGTITIPQPCASSKSMSIPIDTTQLQFGNYDFSLSITDRSGNRSASTDWKAVVDNRALLGADYNAFKNRNVVVYARKNPAKGCSDPTSGGNLTISTNITYSNTGYAKISELPRVMFLADCNIIIDDSVTEVSAWLVAKNNIMTCSVATFNKFKGAGGSPKPTQSDCDKQLVVNGAVQANRLLLMRTNGSDLTDAASRANSAEVFNLRTDQVLSTWAKGRTSGTPRTVYQADIPPQY